jgi:integrase
MKQPIALLPLFQKFIKETETGKRLKKSGARITADSIQNYKNVAVNLERFIKKEHVDWRICDVSKLNKREFASEKNYWKKFYHAFTTYLYSKGCHDNYVGTNIKIIRTFFNYLKYEKDIQTGEFHKHFHVLKQEVEVLVISPEQLKFLIHDVAFDASLPAHLRQIKDVFVFGCTSGLRFSDIYLLANKNFESNGTHWYVKVRSKKTKTYTAVKLPPYAVEIYMKYRSKSNRVPLFTPICLSNFNKHLKTIGKLAGFDAPLELMREKRGKAPKGTKVQPIPFYQKMSSHMMRRTAITTFLILGMQEHLVRKISGHSPTSNSFGRYVHYAQAYIDQEIDKVHRVLGNYEKG